MRRRAKIDSNHHDIADAYRAYGYSVVSLAALGNGIPDLLVARGKVAYLVEVKAPRGTLTPHQRAFMAGWKGPKVAVIRGLDDVVARVAIDAMGASSAGAVV